MVFFLTPSTVLNRSVLETRRLPKRIFDRGQTVIPRGGVFSRVFWRFVFEHVLTRYLIALLPFPALLIAFPDMALPISQAPLFMFAAVYVVETRLLAVPKDKRDALIPEADAARTLDALSARGRGVLQRIAADAGLTTGGLHLVIEQSPLARVAPFTLVSVQVDGDVPHLMDLTAAQRDMIATTLFDDDLTERTLQRTNLRENLFLRDVAFDAGTVSAHARLAALARARAS